jgi:cytochrome b561
VAQLLHWLTALLVIVTIPLGWYANSLERGSLERALFDVHFQVGAAILLLLLVRIAWRTIDRAPQLAPSLPLQVRRAARATHLLMYAALLTMVVSGYLIQIHMHPTLTFLGLEMARPFSPGEDESIRASAWYVHNYTWWLLVALVLAHAGAAFWHHFVWRDDVLRRMLPEPPLRRVPGGEVE